MWYIRILYCVDVEGFPLLAPSCFCAIRFFSGLVLVTFSVSLRTYKYLLLVSIVIKRRIQTENKANKDEWAPFRCNKFLLSRRSPYENRYSRLGFQQFPAIFDCICFEICSNERSVDNLCVRYCLA